MYIAFVVYVAVVAALMLLICSKTCRKIAAGAILFAVLLGAVILPLHGALAEKDIDVVEIEVTGVEPVVFEEELCLRVHFTYQGKDLSWYEYIEEGELFDTAATYRVTLFNGEEVLDAVIK